MERILLATTNPGKIIELRECLKDLPLTLLEPREISVSGTPTEDGTTFDENALKKAKFYFDATGLPVIADDSGIIVDALKGELGVSTRRWGAGPTASDSQWIDVFLKRMRKESVKTARFLCSIATIDAEGASRLFRGVCEGVITDELEGAYLPGLPISACFRPNGCRQTYAAMGTEEKHRISHRGKALALLVSHLKQLTAARKSDAR